MFRITDPDFLTKLELFFDKYEKSKVEPHDRIKIRFSEKKLTSSLKAFALKELKVLNPGLQDYFEQKATNAKYGGYSKETRHKLCCKMAADDTWDTSQEVINLLCYYAYQKSYLECVKAELLVDNTKEFNALNPEMDAEEAVINEAAENKQESDSANQAEPTLNKISSIKSWKIFSMPKSFYWSLCITFLICFILIISLHKFTIKKNEPHLGATSIWNGGIDDCKNVLSIASYTTQYGIETPCWPLTTLSANEGEIINVKIYFHNTGKYEMTNTRAYLSVSPSSRLSNNYIFSAKVVSDQGSIAGTATLHISSSQQIVYNGDLLYNDTNYRIPFPNNQTGDEIMEPDGGVYIGTIPPDDNYAGSELSSHSIVAAFVIRSSKPIDSTILNWNKGPSDCQLISIGNATTKEGINSPGCWNLNSIKAKGGDDVDINIFYHNTTNFDATNTIVKLSVYPQNQFAKEYIFKVTIISDQGVIYGTARLELPEPKTLIFDHTSWFPNHTGNLVDFPNHQNDNAIMTTGINIGTVAFGGAYQGAIVAVFGVSR